MDEIGYVHHSAPIQGVSFDRCGGIPGSDKCIALVIEPRSIAGLLTHLKELEGGLQPSFKMVASGLAGSVGISGPFAAHNWHALGKCSPESLIRLPLFSRETLINPNQR
jgi:hypothetical protein